MAILMAEEPEAQSAVPPEANGCVKPDVTKGVSGSKVVSFGMAAPVESLMEKNLKKGKALSLAEKEAKSFASLNEVLYDLSLPPLIDNTARPKSVPKDTVTVVMLTEPENRVSVCMEGAKQSRGNVLMVINPAWLEKRPIVTSDVNVTPPAGATHSLFVHKAVWFDTNGQAYLDRYEPPRKVTYLANFFTLPGSEGDRDDGVPLEAGLDCPMSSSSALEKITNDKLHTRLLLSRARVAHPQCVAFTFKCPMVYNTSGCTGTYAVHSLSDRAGYEDLFRREAERLCARLARDQVVVKPSGPMWMGSNGVSFWSRKDVDGIVGAATALLQRLWDGDAILLEEFLPTLGPHDIKHGSDVMSPTHAALEVGAVAGNPFAENIVPRFDDSDLSEGDDEAEQEEALKNWKVAPQAIAGIKQAKKLGFRLRVMVARAPWGEPVVTKMVAGIGRLSAPINGSNTIPISFDAVLEQWGIVTVEGKRKVTDTISNEAGRVMKAIMDYEAGMPIEERGGANCQTDLIGIDFIVTPTGTGIMPYVIEVNDHDCSLQAQQLECLLPETRFESVRWWVATMISRSETYLLGGRRILVVGAGGWSKRWVWEGSRKLGVQVVLVEEFDTHFARDLADVFIAFPGLSDHTRDEEHARRIVGALKERQITVEGCLTFWEDCGPLASLVTNLLGTRGNSFLAQSLAKSKFRTQDTLMKDNREYQHKPTTSFFASKAYRLQSEADLERAWEDLGGMPAVLKLEYGSSACGVVLVATKEDALAKFRQIRSELSSEGDHGGVGLGFGSSLVLMEFIEGSEHDVDIVMYDGQTVAAFVTDNGPTRMPYFSETAAAMPSRLHRDKQMVMVAAAAQCCACLGLQNGVFNVEFKMTGMGPKLIEINGRQGGFYIQDWIERVWGVNLLKANILVALGVRPSVFPAPKPRTHIVGRMIYSSVCSNALKTTCTVERLHELHNQGVIVLNQFEPTVPEVEEFEEPFASVGIKSASKAGAKQQLQALWSILGLEDKDPKPCGWYLKNL